MSQGIDMIVQEVAELDAVDIAELLTESKRRVQEYP